MKENFLLAIVLLVLSSCSKYTDNETRELNISLKTTNFTEAIEPSESITDITFYPNPFHDYVNLYINGDVYNSQIIISNTKGDKIELSSTSQVVTLDFSEEDNGAYYCEVLVDERIFRTYIVKY